MGLTWVHLGEEPDGVGVRGAIKLKLFSWLFWFMNSHQPGKGAAVLCVVLCSSLGLELRSWMVLGFICIMRCQESWMVSLFVATFDCRNLHLSFWRETFSRQQNIQQYSLQKVKCQLSHWNGTSLFQDFDEVCFPCRSFTWWIRRKLWNGLAPLGDSLGLDCFWWIEGPFDHVRKAAVWFLDDPV